MSSDYQISDRKHETMIYSTGSNAGGSNLRQLVDSEWGMVQKGWGHVYRSYRGVQEINRGSQLGSYRGHDESEKRWESHMKRERER